jgi:hypothetical protein
MKTHMDVLVLEDYLFFKDAQPSSPTEQAQAAVASAR